jgi:hypothetical protein
VLLEIKKSNQIACVSAQDVSADEFLALWQDYLSCDQYIPLKAVNFGTKTFALCEASRGYLWNFIVYTGAGGGITTSINVPDILQSSRIVVRLVEPNVNLGYTLWVDIYCIQI